MRLRKARAEAGLTQAQLAEGRLPEGQIALAAGLIPKALMLATESLRLAEETGDQKATITGVLLMARPQRAGTT